MVLSSIADGKAAGPLAEYERRIAAGELVDGDAYQVGKTTHRVYSLSVLNEEMIRMKTVWHLPSFEI